MRPDPLFRDGQTNTTVNTAFWRNLVSLSVSVIQHLTEDCGRWSETLKAPVRFYPEMIVRYDEMENRRSERR